LIDLNTDSYGSETSLFLRDIDSYNIHAQEAADVVDFDEWLIQSMEGLDFLNNTGFFSWRNARSIPFENMSPYRYQTCMPQDSCAMLEMESFLQVDLMCSSTGKGSLLTFRHRLRVVFTGLGWRVSKVLTVQARI
jgi:hypothetical protein